VHEVPRLQPTLLTLDHQNALTGEHEEILLVGLGVVQPARLSRAEYLEREADVGEPVNRLERLRRTGVSASKTHLAPNAALVSQAASRTLRTNQPSVSGARPEPTSSSDAS
jgi:hypothetical protein